MAKYQIAEQWLLQYSQLYWYPVDYYMLDESQRVMLGELNDYEFYVDKVVNFFMMLPKKTLYVRILAPEAETEQNILGYILTMGFDVAIPDILLRQEQVALRVGDVIASAGVFEELAQLKSFEQFTKPVFVRFVQDIKPSIFVLQYNNTLEWKLRVSDADIVFRLAT
jgi:hypothetical protein